MTIMIAILITALVGLTAFLLGKLNDPIGRELDGMRGHAELSELMTPVLTSRR